MPELPEVESLRRSLKPYIIGQTINLYQYINLNWLVGQGR